MGKSVEKEIEFVKEIVETLNLSLPEFIFSEKMKEKIKWCKNQEFVHFPVVNIEGSETKFENLDQILSFAKECESSFSVEDKFQVESVRIAVLMNDLPPKNGIELTFFKDSGDTLQINTKTTKFNLFCGFFGKQTDKNEENKAEIEIFYGNSPYKVKINKKSNYWEGYNAESYRTYIGSVYFNEKRECFAKVGIFSTEDGRIKYIGSFENNRFHGKGKIFTDNKLTYEGSWFQGIQKGYGKLYENSDLVYEGDFENCKKNGEGSSFFKNKPSYSGEWSSDCRHGEGVSYMDGIKDFKGCWVNHKRDGFGISYHRNGSQSFIGHFKINKEK
jgi:hypothetical protein